MTRSVLSLRGVFEKHDKAIHQKNNHHLFNSGFKGKNILLSYNKQQKQTLILSNILNILLGLFSSNKYSSSLPSNRELIEFIELLELIDLLVL